MSIVTRHFTQIEPKADDTPRPLSSFDATPALVVLGDPGAGKTTSFRAAADAEDQAECISVRDFLTLSLQRWQGKRLYLDGLDEQRSKTKDGAGVLDQVRARLDELGRPSFRLSCRAADWFGASDLAALRVVSPTQSVTVVRLEPLSDQDIHNIARETIRDPQAFIEEAKRRGLYDFLVNPQTLQLILAAVSENSWPATRSALFEEAARILGREVNPEHAHYQGPTFSSEEILSASGYLWAVHLCAGTVGISLTAEHDSQEFPFIGNLSGARDVLVLAARRRTFQSEGTSGVRPIHRTVAEFLAARYLAQQVRGSFSLGRVLALIMGSDGGTLSDLRGLYAWLASLLPQFAESLIPKDPLAVVLYGDCATLPPTIKSLVLKSLADLSEANPWFRSEDWSSRPFGGLSSPEMESEFRQILSDPAHHPVFLSCVLDAIANGHPLPRLGDLLLSIVSDGSKPEFVRRDAISALANACPDRVNEFLRLLDSIHIRDVPDPTCALRGDLLSLLYPGIIPPERVASYLIDETEGHVNSYTMFVSRDLVRRTPPDAFPSLLDSISQMATQPQRKHKLIWSDLLGQLTLNLLRHHGSRVQALVVYEWLGKTLDEYGEPVPEREEFEAIREWLTAHPSLTRELFCHWVATTPFNNPAFEEHLFWRRLYRSTPPDGFPHWLLDLAEIEARPHVAHFLFRLAVQYTTVQGRADGLTVDELFALVEQHPEFRGTLEAELAWEIPEWRIEEAIARQERAQARQAVRRGTVDSLQQEINAIRSGTSIRHLNFLAKLYFGLFSDVDHDLAPHTRLIAETNSEIAQAARHGFLSVLQSPRIPTPQEIAQAHVQSKEHFVRLPVLAGMEIFARESPEAVLTLPDRTLEGALAFFFVGPTDPQPDWMKQLVSQRPQLSARALHSLWHVHLKSHSRDVPGIHDLLEDQMAGVGRSLALLLLRRFPACAEETLRVLLRASIKASPTPSLLSLARHVLARRGVVRGVQRILWLGTAFLLRPDDSAPRVARYASRRRLEEAAALLTYLHPSHTERQYPQRPLGVQAMITLIGQFGPVFTPEDLKGSGWLGLHSLGRGGGSIQSMIDHLKRKETADISRALVLLRDDSRLRKWRDYLAHAVADQARQRREAQFRYPELPQVIETLRNGRPGNARDLQCLILEQLSVLHERLRHGSTDGYKTFWNVDSYGRAVSPRPEESCRDRLVDLLRPMLSAFEVILEPEGHQAEDKRVDIKCVAPGLTIPLEIKRHYHRQLWTAPSKQLKRLYARDPDAEGRGIYLVLWFGTEFKLLPSAPRGIGRATGPEELRIALRLTLPKSEWDLIEIVVHDCSVPRATRRRHTSAKT
jgi:hypothetical protein